MAEQDDDIPEGTADVGELLELNEQPAINPARPLPQTRRELFVINLISGMGIYDSYLKAGFSGKQSKCASDIHKHPDVQARLQYLLEREYETVMEDRARARCNTIYTEAMAMIEAEQVRALAMKLGRPASAVAAITLKGRISGVLRKDDDYGDMPVKDMSLAYLEKLRAELRRDIKQLSELSSGSDESEGTGNQTRPVGGTRH
jgi:hypothetical protein